MVTAKDFESRMLNKDEIVETTKKGKWKKAINNIFRKIGEKTRLCEFEHTIYVNDYPKDMREFVISQLRKFGYFVDVAKSDDNMLDEDALIFIDWDSDILHNTASEEEVREYAEFISAETANEMTKNMININIDTINKTIMTEAKQGSNLCLIADIPDIVKQVLLNKGYNIVKSNCGFKISWEE